MKDEEFFMVYSFLMVILGAAFVALNPTILTERITILFNRFGVILVFIGVFIFTTAYLKLRE